MTFLCLVMKVLGKVSKEADYLSKALPQTVHSHRQSIATCFGTEDNFEKYSVCKGCHSLYKIKDCSQRHGTQIDVKQCSYK